MLNNQTKSIGEKTSPNYEKKLWRCLKESPQNEIENGCIWLTLSNIKEDKNTGIIAIRNIDNIFGMFNTELPLLFVGFRSIQSDVVPAMLWVNDPWLPLWKQNLLFVFKLNGILVVIDVNDTGLLKVLPRHLYGTIW